MDPEAGPAGLIIVGALMLFWVGMLVGLLFSWISVGLAGIGFAALRGTENSAASGGVLVLCALILGSIQIAVGLGIVVARIKRRGTLDADDAGLLEG